jgi:hypothetical protein
MKRQRRTVSKTARLAARLLVYETGQCSTFGTAILCRTRAVIQMKEAALGVTAKAFRIRSASHGACPL